MNHITDLTDNYWKSRSGKIEPLLVQAGDNSDLIARAAELNSVDLSRVSIGRTVSKRTGIPKLVLTQIQGEIRRELSSDECFAKAEKFIESISANENLKPGSYKLLGEQYLLLPSRAAIGNRHTKQLRQKMTQKLNNASADLGRINTELAEMLGDVSNLTDTSKIGADMISLALLVAEKSLNIANRLFAPNTRTYLGPALSLCIKRQDPSTMVCNGSWVLTMIPRDHEVIISNKQIASGNIPPSLEEIEAYEDGALFKKVDVSKSILMTGIPRLNIYRPSGDLEKEAAAILWPSKLRDQKEEIKKILAIPVISAAANTAKINTANVKGLSSIIVENLTLAQTAYGGKIPIESMAKREEDQAKEAGSEAHTISTQHGASLRGGEPHPGLSHPSHRYGLSGNVPEREQGGSVDTVVVPLIGIGNVASEPEANSEDIFKNYLENRLPSEMFGILRERTRQINNNFGMNTYTTGVDKSGRQMVTPSSVVKQSRDGPPGKTDTVSVTSTSLCIKNHCVASLVDYISGVSNLTASGRITIFHSFYLFASYADCCAVAIMMHNAEYDLGGDIESVLGYDESELKLTILERLGMRVRTVKDKVNGKVLQRLLPFVPTSVVIDEESPSVAFIGSQKPVYEIILQGSLSAPRNAKYYDIRDIVSRMSRTRPLIAAPVVGSRIRDGQGMRSAIGGIADSSEYEKGLQYSIQRGHQSRQRRPSVQSSRGHDSRTMGSDPRQIQVGGYRPRAASASRYPDPQSYQRGYSGRDFDQERGMIPYQGHRYAWSSNERHQYPSDH